MKLIKTYGRTARAAAALIASIERRAAASTAKVDTVVSTILTDVRQGGDRALEEYAGRFDGLLQKDGSTKPLRVTRDEMEDAWHETAPALREAMKIAQGNLRAFAEAQRPEEWMMEAAPGLTTGQIVRPLASVGCYVPGGRFPLPSTLFMTVTPAQVAGVERIVVCSPKPAKETLAAAYLADVPEFYRIGGAQAVAAMAYGTESLARVEKIVGPGNLYVTAAKRKVQDDCGIDMPAGPTEIGIMSERGEPEGLAADLVAQAEHDPEALAVLVTSNEPLARAVLAAVDLQAKALAKRGNPLAAQALQAQGAIFVTENVAEARELTNRLAFEHLSVDSMADLAWVRDAGSVFVGRFSPQSMGDYISGPNHVLPTGRAGRIRGGLSIFDFVKIITVQQYTRAGLKALGPHAIALAEAEGLIGHAQSVRVKLGGMR
jgi:histidinol dehydrogenase